MTVTPDSFSDAPFHLSHSGHGAVLRLPSRPESPGHSGYDPDVSASVLDLGETDSEAAGSDGLLHPACETHQMAYVGFAVGFELSVGTTPRKSF